MNKNGFVWNQNKEGWWSGGLNPCVNFFLPINLHIAFRGTIDPERNVRENISPVQCRTNADPIVKQNIAEKHMFKTYKPG